MKLFIVLSVIACVYADKLDRTYLPPANAGTSGGSPGSLNTPLGPSGFGQPAGFGQSRPSFGAGPTGPANGQSGQNGFGAQPNQYQAGSGPTGGANYDAGFGGPAQNFGNQAQDYQRSQPQRAQASAEQAAEILRSDSQNDGETFSYSFETSNGISAEESGVATNGVQAQGAFAYTGDDGQAYRVQYTADENGYQPQGDHLPTSPPIPEEILKSIEENARAAAAGTQEGAYNPDEDNNEVSQQYNNNAPTSYNNAPNSYKQAPTGQTGFNQAGKSPAQLYGAPNAGSRPQGPLQQYNAGSGAPNGNPAGPSNGFGPQAKSPSQAYGSPSNGAGNSASRPNSFNQQGPAQQYSAGPSGGSNFALSGSQTRPQQYQASSSGQSPSAGRPQGSSQGQDASGYQYDKPQGGFGGNSNNGPAQQYRPQNGAPAGPQGYSRPSGNAFPTSGSNGQGSFGASPNSQGSFGSAPTSKSQGSFGSAPTSNSQGSFGSAPTSNSQGSFGSAPTSYSQGSFGSAPTSNSQGSFGSAPTSYSQGSYAPSGSNGPSGPKSSSPFGSNGQSSFGAPARPNSAFGASSGSQPSAPNGFRQPQAGSNGQAFSRPQGQAPGAKSPMSGSGYEYNQPAGNSQFGSSPSQSGNAQFGGSNGFKSTDQGRPSQFGAPRAPPSFSEEEGYKY